MGKKDAASAQLQAALRVDPRHVPSLHGLALLALEKHDAAQADQFIKRIEAIDPTYGQLADLRTRLQVERGGK
jgi:Tfp pilus assembly protein PilF